jgi:anaerobic ribonucleoside-triphosphate reductase activating protein
MMNDTLRISGTVDESIVDGKGIRYVVFTQGCPHNCPGCHNPQTHDFNGGKDVSVSTLFEEIVENPLLRGVTFSGGEPFCQPLPLAELGKLVHARKLDVTTYTGYTLEQLQAKNDPNINALLEQTDVLIDGRFELEQRDLTLLFRGSRNQRVIDVKKTLASGQVVLYEV